VEHSKPLRLGQRKLGASGFMLRISPWLQRFRFITTDTSRNADFAGPGFTSIEAIVFPFPKK